MYFIFNTKCITAYTPLIYRLYDIFCFMFQVEG